MSTLALLVQALSSRPISLVLEVTFPGFSIFLLRFALLFISDVRDRLFSPDKALGGTFEPEVHLCRELHPFHHELTDVQAQTFVRFQKLAVVVRARSRAFSASVVQAVMFSTTVSSSFS